MIEDIEIQTMIKELGATIDKYPKIQSIVWKIT